MDADRYIPRLRNNSLKVTPRRKAVIELFVKEKKYLGPLQIRKLLGTRHPVGLPSIYRILDELERAGILVKIAHRNRQLYYSLCGRPDDNDHHHFICRKCRKVEEVPVCGFPAVARFIEKKLKGTVKYHSLHLEGLCSECK
jgi:Fur family transcriptional regulator, ferric uptake regulator